MPGVHAYATAGVGTSNSTRRRASAAAVRRARWSHRRAAQSRLYAEPLALTTNRFAEIGARLRDDVVDRFPCGVDVFAHRLGDIVEREIVDHLGATVTRDAISLCGSRARPSRAFDALLGRPARAGCRALARPSRALEARQPGVPCAADRRTDQRTDRPTAARPRRSSKVTPAPIVAPSSAAVSRSYCCSRSSSSEFGRRGS